MECLNCHKEMPQDAWFCPYCRFEQYIVCSHCGNQYSAQYQYCSKCGANSNNSQNRYTNEAQERKRVVEEDRMIRNTTEYTDAYVYITQMIRSHRKRTTMIWLYFVLSAATLALLSLSGLIVDSENLFLVFMIPATYLGMACLTLIPIILAFIARSSKNRDKLINKYISSHPFPPQLQSILTPSFNYIKTLGNMSRRRFKKRVPNILLNSYKFVHYYDELG